MFNIPKFNKFFDHSHHPAPVVKNFDEIKQFARGALAATMSARVRS